MRTKNKVFLFTIILGCCLYSREQERQSQENKKPNEASFSAVEEERKEKQQNAIDNLLSVLAKEPEPTPDYSANFFDNIGMYEQYPDLISSKPPVWDNTDLPQIDLFSAKGDWGFLKPTPSRNFNYQR